MHTIYTFIFKYLRKNKYSLEKELAGEFEKDMTQYVQILQRQYEDG